MTVDGVSLNLTLHPLVNNVTSTALVTLFPGSSAPVFADIDVRAQTVLSRRHGQRLLPGWFSERLLHQRGRVVRQGNDPLDPRGWNPQHGETFLLPLRRLRDAGKTDQKQAKRKLFH
jgi:hypothetical protein